MAYILSEDQLCLRVKAVILFVLLNVINDGDAGEHADNVADGVGHLRGKLRRWPHRTLRASRAIGVRRPKSGVLADPIRHLYCMRLTNPTYHFAAEFVEVGG